MRVIIEPGTTNDVIATVAIGEPCFNAWSEFALPTWRRYCERHELGLVAFDADLVSKESKIWKKPNWQKLLVGNALESEAPNVRNVCILDTDILINYTSPNVFDGYDADTISLVSARKNLPYPREQVLRRMAFLRNRYYDADYPLDSALFVSLEDLYEMHGLTPQEDEACSGVIMFNVDNHSDLMSGWFGKYDRHLMSITGGGEQTHVNYEIQNWGGVSWLDYRYQALWTYEMPWKYPFLYRTGTDQEMLLRECIEASLFANYFLHFAGSWHESEMWKAVRVLETAEVRERFEGFREYERVPVTGLPVGAVKPKPASFRP